MSEQFKKDSLSKLSHREQAREKLPTFYGSRDNYYHGAREILNNSTDEILSNFDKGVINVELSEDCETISISDTGRGMPIDDVESVELLLETLFASGKYEANGNSLAGVNGVGACTLNFTSDLFECESHMNGEYYRVTYSDGGQNRVYEQLGNTDKHGTIIRFKLDKNSYTETTYDPQVIEDLLRRTSCVSNRIKIIYTFMGETKTFQNTLEEYFDNYSQDIIGHPTILPSKTYSKQTTVERKGKRIEVTETAQIDMVFGTCVGDNLLQETMLNGNYLKENGSIYDGILEGFRTYLNRHCKKNNLLKAKDKQISILDIENSVSFVVRLFSNLVEFEGQTKFSTKKEYYKEVARTYVLENLEVFEIENRQTFERLVQQVLICKKANETNEKAKQVLKKKLTSKVDNMDNKVEGFVDCEKEYGGELFLTEGKSALGSIVLARNAQFQAGYSLRGKMINALKNPIDKVLNNEEVKDILALLECGIEIQNKYTKDLPKFDINKMRWGKVILTADADSDGKQINVLVLTMIYKLCPSLIKEGFIWIAQPPLFEIKVSDDEKYYALTVSEKDEIVSKLNKKAEIHRIKGLGESSKEVMSHTVCDPNSRILQQVTVDDVEAMISSFTVWLDTKVDERKDYIESQLQNYLVDPPIEDVTESKDVAKIVQDNMMDYSAEVIFDRALPSVETGLKPSQLRTLWAMYVNKYFNLTKSLNVTGAVTQYHPHGSVYPTIVNMCQGDRHQLPLIVGEGNFGQYTSNLLMEASDRYTNVKLSPLALSSLKEIDKKYVSMVPTYDEKKTMPLYLPSKYPIILTQASEGMAVGMASKMPSFNFNEICGAIIKYLKTETKTVLIPDFATYGYIMNNEQVIESINDKGRGTVRLRGKCIVEDNSIIINEIPYGVTREDIIDKVIELVKKDKLKEIVSIKDLTDLKNMTIKIDCKKNTNLDLLIEKLYALTPLESTYPCNMNVLVDGMPKVMGVWDIINHWLDFRQDCIVRGFTYEKNKHESQLHLLKGFINIIEQLDKVIEIIRFSDNPQLELQTTFNLDELQSSYIYELSLKDINKNYIQKKIDNIEVLSDKLNYLNTTINSTDALIDIIISDLEQVNKDYNSPRRTQVIENIEKRASQETELIVEDYNVQFILTKEGYFKKNKLTSLRGSVTQRLKDGDKIVSERQGSNINDLLVFTNNQNCYKVKANDIEDHKTSVLGLYLPSYLSLEDGEEVVDVIPTNYAESLLIVFDNGKVVKIPTKSYETKTNRTRLKNAICDSKIVKMFIITKDSKYVLLSANRRILIFDSANIPMKISKTSQGIYTMRHKNIEIVDCQPLEETSITDEEQIKCLMQGKAGHKFIYTNKGEE